MGTWTHSLQQESDERSPCVKMKEVMGCTHTDCHCHCFLPGRGQIRSCDRCTHGWVAHAVGKVCGPALVCSGQVELVQSDVVFDISSLILYGTQALPVRMKILLDRLFSVLTHTQVLNIIHTLGWTLRDYVRGYMLQDSMGKVLDRWLTMSPEDEVVTLRQFLRFGETRSIVELMSEKLRPEAEGRSERGSSFRAGDAPHHFKNLPGGSVSFLQPLHFISHPERRPVVHRPQRSRRGAPDPPAPPRRHRPSPPSFRKGRVSCDACAKSFYDRGTLKIHVNAVHLQIKHRCTVSGCSMMFSSLRSRNRHSANPNPRLHAPAGPRPQRRAGSTATAHQSCPGNALHGMPKKRKRKSSTPLKIYRQPCDHNNRHEGGASDWMVPEGLKFKEERSDWRSSP